MRIVGLLVIVAGLVGCDRPAPVTTTRPSSGAALAGLHDWVLEPQVVESERGTCKLHLVCAAPSVTEICCALGLREQIVGRTRFCDYPPDIRSVPAVGALDETNAEVLMSVQPDLVLVSGTSRAIAQRLEGLNLRVETLPDRTLDDIFSAISRIGELTGRPATAQKLVEGLQAELELITQRYADVPPARVLLLLDVLADPPAAPFVAGPGSFYDDLLRRAGHTNVLEDGSRAYGPLSLEMIVRADPDVIIELDATGTARPGGDADALRVWGQLGQLLAVENRRVRVLTGQRHFIPGPRIAQHFAELCQAIAERGDD